MKEVKEENKHGVLTHIDGIRKNGTDEAICRAGTETQTQRTDMWAREGGSGPSWERSADIYAPPRVKLIAMGSCRVTGSSAPCSDDLVGGGRGAEKGRLKREERDVDIKQMHVVV